ncbi:MAG: peptidylprolyl isomerase [Phycisphaerae bacterium]|nr:peptidylprolyl isomerase [Phycisphaerae bacterium]
MSAGLVTQAGCEAQKKASDSSKKTTAAETKPETTEKTVTEKDQNAAKNPVVIIETSMGTIKAELFADKAPKTVTNFLLYTDEKFFDGLIFHRVIAGFMIQGGGFTPQMQQKPTHGQIENEASAETPNDRGTLAMARTNEVHSATAQFFINLKDNGFLNHKDKTAAGFGYCVFGKVIDGMDVVDKIAAVRTGKAGRFGDVPIEQVVIKSVRRAE